MARALVLTGGGVTGALYEVGILRALEERFGSPLDLFDLFVGISAGASVTAFIAQGVSPTRLYEALLDQGDQLFPLEQRHLAALDLVRALRLAGTAASLALRALGRMVVRRRAPSRATTSDLPSGLFDTEPYRRFFATSLAERGLSDDFRRLPRALLIPATAASCRARTASASRSGSADSGPFTTRRPASSIRSDCTSGSLVSGSSTPPPESRSSSRNARTERFSSRTPWASPLVAKCWSGASPVAGRFSTLASSLSRPHERGPGHAPASAVGGAARERSPQGVLVSASGVILRATASQDWRRPVA
jgi:hypothetical protein